MKNSEGRGHPAWCRRLGSKGMKTGCEAMRKQSLTAHRAWKEGILMRKAKPKAEPKVEKRRLAVWLAGHKPSEVTRGMKHSRLLRRRLLACYKAAG